MKKICSIIMCFAIIMSGIVWVNAENDGVNYIDIGNIESEENVVDYVNASEPQTNIVDGVVHTYRTLDKNGEILVTMECKPDKVNYLTVKLWGDDTGDTMLWVCDPVTGNMNVANDKKPSRNDLVDRRDWVELNSLKASPQYNGGFIYATYMIPTIYTDGKDCVQLKIYSTGGSADYSSDTVKEQTEPSRGIYAVYMTQDANFEPSEFEPITGKLTSTAEITAPSYETQKETVKKYALDAVETFKSWQIYGQDNYPGYMEGMVTRGTDWQNKSKTDSDWKDIYYKASGGMLQQNMTPLNMYEIFAIAYKNSDKLGYDDEEKTELLDRIVKGVDFLVRAQGANGGFYSSDGWIGGPDRINASGNNLTGFGLRSVANAVVMVYDDIKNGGYLSKYIDSDADGFGDVYRKNAWADMMAAARDYLVSLDGAGHAPNQDMADIISAVRFEKALQMMDSDLSWKSQGLEDEIENQLDIAFGFKTNISCSSYWVSPKGIILENFGSIQGGYSGDYGIAALEELSQLAEFAEDYYGAKSETAEKYTDMLDRAYDSSDKFMFIENADINNSPTLYSEGIISNRNSYYPGTERYVLDFYAAVSKENKTALKTFENFFAHNKLEKESEAYTQKNVHFEDNALSTVKLYVNFDNVVSKLDSENISGYNYIMENDNIDEYAWADEMGRNVVIKNGVDKIYLALNWRNPIHSATYYNTDTMRDRQSGLMNNLARVHHKTDRYDKYGYAEMSTVGWNVRTAESCDFQLFNNHYAEAFMYMNYGDYAIIMNSNNLIGRENDISYPIPWEELNLNGLYKDLTSGKYYYFGEAADGAIDGKNAEVPSASTMVLYKTLPEGEAQILGVSYADNTVSVTASSNESERVPVTVYAAEYNGGILVNVEQQKQTVTGKSEIKFQYEKTDDNNSVKIFVWDNGMKPLYEATEW